MASLLRTDSYKDVSIFANFLVIVLGNSYNYCGIGFKTRKNITQKWVKKHYIENTLKSQIFPS